jgi:hypothetical protein
VKRAVVAVALLLLAGCSSVKLTRVPTTLELMRILDLHIWWMPAGDWTLALADAQPLGTKDAGLLHTGGETLISMRPIGDGRYEVTIGDRRETIDAGGQVRFFDPPRCNADCSAYVAGEVGGRQIVLSLRSG